MPRSHWPFQVQGILNELDKDQDGKLSWQEHLQDLHRFHDPPEDAAPRWAASAGWPMGRITLW